MTLEWRKKQTSERHRDVPTCAYERERERAHHTYVDFSFCIFYVFSVFFIVSD